MRMCQRCKTKPSTGMLVHLCNECFDEWEREVKANPKSVDVGPIDEMLKTKSGVEALPTGYRNAALN